MCCLYIWGGGGTTKTQGRSLLPIRPCWTPQRNVCLRPWCVHGSPVQVTGSPGLTFLCGSEGGLLLGWSRCCSANRHHAKFTCEVQKNTHVNKQRWRWGGSGGGEQHTPVRGPLCVRLWPQMAKQNPFHSLGPIIFKLEKKEHSS